MATVRWIERIIDKTYESGAIRKKPRAGQIQLTARAPRGHILTNGRVDIDKTLVGKAK
jgi:hypothetical protein